MLAVARAAEAAGFDSIWLYDHLHPMGLPKRSILECWTTLTALTAATERIIVGTLVTRNGLRHPSLLAKMIATVDQIGGGGRLIVGLGTGDRVSRPEHRRFGLPYYTPQTRFARLGESLAVLRALLSGETVDYSGRYHRLRQATARPRPVLPPHPPLWLGGSARAVLDLAAEHAQGWNWWGTSPERFKVRARDLAAHCRERGRDPDELTLSWAGAVTLAATSAEAETLRAQFGATYLAQNIVGSPPEVCDRLLEYQAAGVQHAIIDFPGIDEKLPALQRFAEQVRPVVG